MSQGRGHKGVTVSGTEGRTDWQQADLNVEVITIFRNKVRAVDLFVVAVKFRHVLPAERR